VNWSVRWMGLHVWNTVSYWFNYWFRLCAPHLMHREWNPMQIQLILEAPVSMPSFLTSSKTLCSDIWAITSRFLDAP
jgi:hypothetical protein